MNRPTAARRVYADATALIGLARIDRLDLLDLLPTPIFVTERVWAEVASDPGKPGVEALLSARERGLLSVVFEGDPAALPELDAGESTVLTAAVAVQGAVLVDERKARALIERDPRLRASIAQASGIVGLILLAKRHGRITAVRPLLEDLVRHNFWISQSFYQEILRLAGEQTAEGKLPVKRPRRRRKPTNKEEP